MPILFHRVRLQLDCRSVLRYCQPMHDRRGAPCALLSIPGAVFYTAKDSDQLLLPFFAGPDTATVKNQSDFPPETQTQSSKGKISLWETRELPKALTQKHKSQQPGYITELHCVKRRTIFEATVWKTVSKSLAVGANAAIPDGLLASYSGLAGSFATFWR